MDQSQENPFMHIVQQFSDQFKDQESGGEEQPGASALVEAQAAAQQQGAPAQGAPAGGAVPNVMKSDLDEGNIQGTTPSIVQAINALNNVIKTSQDRETIMVMRSVVSLLSRFVMQDQEAQATVLAPTGQSETPAP